MQFTQFTKTEFEAFLHKKYSNFKILPSSTIKAQEYIYEIPITHNTAIRISSSIDKFTQKSRPYSKDSIKTILINPMLHINLSGKNPTKRTKNWEKNLEEKIDTLIKISKSNYVKTCPKCKSHTVIRRAHKGQNNGNLFIGCSKYPKCNFVTSLPSELSIPSSPISSSPLSPSSPSSPIPRNTTTIQPKQPQSSLKEFTLKDAQTLGKILNVDFTITPINKYVVGLNYEQKRLGHTTSNKKLSETVINNLKSSPTYYTSRSSPTSPSTPSPSSPPSPTPSTDFAKDISDGLIHENCGGLIQLTKSHRDRENEIMHWDAKCRKCKHTGIIVND